MGLVLERDIFDALAVQTGFYGEKEHVPQRRFIDAFFSGKHQFYVNVWGRQTGKTMAAAMPVMYGALQSNQTIWVVSKTYDLCGRLWKYMIPNLRKVLVEGRDFIVHKSTGMIETRWNTTIEQKSADHPDSLIGAKVTLLVPDEAATLPDPIWYQYLEPTTAIERARVVFTTTPRGMNWVYNLYELGQDPSEPDYWSSHATCYDNPYWPIDVLERTKRNTDPLVWRQEYLAEFVVFAHQVYSTFTREKHVISHPDLSNWTISVAVDPGLNNPTAILWIAHNPTTGEDVVFKEHIASNMLFPDVLRVLQENMPDGGYDIMVCDVAGKARGQETGRSFFGWMRDHDMYFQARRVGIVDGVNRVRGRLYNVEGETHLFVTEDCLKTIQAFEGYHYPEKEGEQKEEPEKDGVHDHPMDALRYYVAWRHAGESARSWTA